MKTYEVEIRVERVSKRIKDQLILDNVNLEIPKGKIYGLIGRNGSGKTMLLRILCGLVRPTAGRVNVLGEDITQSTTFPQQVGAIIENPGLLPQYSGIQNLRLLASIRDKVTDDQIVKTMRMVGLDPDNRKPVRTYSLGMRQRLGIAQAIMEKPQLLILDEPTNGLDTEGVSELHKLLFQQRSDGVTILLTSHNMEEINSLCDAVFRMESGRLLQIDNLDPACIL